MSKLVTSDNLKAYHSELAEHLQMLERNKSYSVGDTVKYDGLTLKCTIAGNTDVNKVDYSSIDVGDTIVDGTVTFTVIDPNSMWYEEDKFYMVDDIVVYNDKFYKCIIAHTATATFDTTKWSEISNGDSGGGISTYTTGTSYSSGDVVIKDNQLYQANTTTSTTWVDSEWNLIATTVTNSTAYVQKVVPDVVAPYELLVKVGDTNYCKAPVNVLKKTGSQSDIAITLENFNNSSAYTNSGDFVSIGSGKAKISTSKEFSTSPLVLDTQTVYVSEQIDYNGFKKRQGSGIDNNTLLMLHFDDTVIKDECGNTITTYGTVTKTSDSKFGSGAVSLSGTDAGLGVAYDPKFDFGTGDFTIDFWWKVPSGTSAIPSSYGYGDIIGSKDITGQPNIAIRTNNYWLFWTTGGSDIGLGQLGYAEDGIYHHYAIVKANGTTYIFIDGDLKGQLSSSYSIDFMSNEFILLGNASSSRWQYALNGYFDEFRISNVARWTENFTPPNEAYAKGGTQVTSLEVI